jgi:hypothetical protein
MTIEKTYQGALKISDIIGGQFVSRQYFGYSKREALRLFKDETATQERKAPNA